MFDERAAMRQLLSLKKEGNLEDKTGDIAWLYLDNGIVLRVEKLEQEEYSVLPFYKYPKFEDEDVEEKLYPLIYDDVGYGIMNLGAIVNHYMLKEDDWAVHHLK